MRRYKEKKHPKISFYLRAFAGTAFSPARSASPGRPPNEREQALAQIKLRRTIREYPG